MVQSFQDLLTGLELILNAIEQNNVGQFWLHEDADSYLAELIKQSYEVTDFFHVTGMWWNSF